ncbi:MAG: sialate O-acetylesterase, partial [Chthoniobacteraceae bacterium]
LALKSGTLKGILWHQGESDSNTKLAPSYEAKLHDLVARMRKELAAPEVPFIVGQMGKFAEAPWDDAHGQVDKAHQDLPKKVKRTAYVSAEGLKHRGDKIHFDSPSCREFGRRYFDAFQSLTKAVK